MDVYEPKGDNMTQRPLLILAFGGSFVFGRRTDGYMQDLGNTFAKKGYVVASIDYRTTPSLITNPSPRNFYGAVVKGSHDMLASVRYFRKDVVENSNTFAIDTNLIYIGGVSAGAVSAIHAAYLRDPSEFPAELDTTGIGGTEGLSGNPNYSSRVAGVLNWCGAIGDSAWIDADEVPMLSMHGDNDDVVPYGSANVTILNANLPVDGSASMHVKMNDLGIENPFVTWEGAGHTPFLQGFSSTPALYMDSLFNFSSEVLYGWLCEYYSTTTSLSETLEDEIQLELFPNPVQNILNIKWQERHLVDLEVSLFDLSGNSLEVQIRDSSEGLQIARGDIPAGYYVLRIEEKRKQKRIFKNVLFR